MASIKNKQIDLLVAYNRSDEPSHLSKFFKASIVPGSILLVVIVLAVSMSILIYTKQSALNNLKGDIEVVELKIDGVDKTPYEELAKMESALSSIESLDKSLSELPELTKSKIMYLSNDLLSGMSLNSISFDQKTNVMDVSISSGNVQNIQKYVTKIRKHVEFSSVDYTGYQQSSTPVFRDINDPESGDYSIVDSMTTYTFNVRVALDGKVSE